MKITIQIRNDSKKTFKQAVKDLDKLYDHIEKDIEVFNVRPDGHDSIATITIEKEK